MSDGHYDLIVIGSGPGGGSLAQRLAPTGKRILILERGDYLKREDQNWSSQAVFVDARYQAKETWTNSKGKTFAPGLHYFVGGNSKVYGSALLRLREGDFKEIRHFGGVSPAWPLGYDVFEPYYGEAETLFQVHGLRGDDPWEPPASTPYAYPPITHDPHVAELDRRLKGLGLHPFHLPMGIILEEDEHGQAARHSKCIKCSYFDGFPCPLDAKADSQVICIDPMLAAHPNTVTLMTGAYVSRLETDPTGRTVTGVHVEREGREEVYSADIVVVACGALSSALLLLRSASDAHPDGLANGSGLVGRNYMRHQLSVLAAVFREKNDTVFQKTLGMSDWYFGADDSEHPLGFVQMCATSHADQIRAEVLTQAFEWLPEMPFDVVAEHSMDFWLQSEDPPHRDNRIYYKDGKVHLDVHDTNGEAMRRLKKKFTHALTEAKGAHVLLNRSLYLGKDITENGTSLLDLNCKAHELDNLYVADASFFPSIGAVNPTLTIIANALRVADHLKERLG
jgi:choline dehydrogenase-like flavoprotein